MPDVIERAKARRAELMAEVARIDDLLSRHKALAAEMAAALESPMPQTSAALKRRAVEHTPTGRKRGPNGSSPEQIVSAARDIIVNAERPMTRFELIAPIEDRGLVIGGVDKARNLGTILWRSKQFKSTGDGYWPDDGEPPPPSPEPDDEIDLGSDDALGIE